MEIWLFIISLTAIGGFLEYWACRVKVLGILLPAALAVGIILFMEADKRHAAELMAMGVIPEGLALVAGMLLMVPLFVGTVLGGIIYYIRKRKT